MKITMFSNYLNHLQTSFCDELYRNLGTDFTFVSVEPLPKERLLSGYQDCSGYVYNLNAFENENNHQKAVKLGTESDIVIAGASSFIYIKERLRLKKHTFRYSERFLKRGDWLLLSPRFLFKLIKGHILLANANTYMLCAGAFASRDFGVILAYPSRKYKFGYFTEVQKIDIETVIKNKPVEKIEIVWTARFLDWKHPELAVSLALQLKNLKYNFHLTMIGEGELKEPIQKMVNRLKLNDCVSLIGSISNMHVREQMLGANIFLFTSDRNEGWGVVLNEAMSSGCAVLAADEIGAVSYLIDNEQNGLTFASGNLAALVKQCEKLMKDKHLRDTLARQAYFTVEEIWNPVNAAKNFMTVANGRMRGENVIIDIGPCSLA